MLPIIFSMLTAEQVKFLAEKYHVYLLKIFHFISGIKMLPIIFYPILTAEQVKFLSEKYHV